MLQLQRIQIQKGVQEVSVGSDGSTPTAVVGVVHTTFSLAMEPGITMMDPPPPVIHIDQNLLKELRKRFPEVPHHVIIRIVQQNGNDREQCMMALARESQNYPDAPASSSIEISVHNPNVTNSNGIRARSDSTESRGSVGTGQSPSSQAHYGPSHGPLLYHSSSNPAFQTQHSHYANQGSKTAPAQTEGFSPFNTHRNSLDDTSRNTYSPVPTVGPYVNFGPSSTGSNVRPGMANYNAWTGGVMTSQPGYMSGAVNNPGTWIPAYGTPPTGHVGPGAGSMPSMTAQSRPGQFEQNFPPAQYKTGTFSPESPCRGIGAGPVTPTHGQSCQSPDTTTPPRPSQVHPWDKYSPVTPPRSTQTPPTTSPSFPFHTPSPPQSLYGQRTEHQHSKTYRSELSQYIDPEGMNSNMTGYGTPRHCINIQVRPQPSGSPYHNISSMGNVLPGQRYTHPAAMAAGSVTLNVAQHMPYTQNPLVCTLSNSLMGGDRQMGKVAQQPNLPLTSPGSSTGGAPDAQSSRSGSLPGVEDTAYIQSLVLHQRSRLEKLQQDLIAAYKHCDGQRHQVSIKEKCLLDRRKSRSGIRPNISMTDLQKVREENRMLQVDSHLMTLEFDRITKGEPIIGQDPHENFYARIPPGQRSSLINFPEEGTSSLNGSSLSTISHPPSHPPAPPGLISGNHGSHDGDRELPNVHEVEEENWSCSACTFANHPELSSCEICNMPRLARR